MPQATEFYLVDFCDLPVPDEQLVDVPYNAHLDTIYPTMLTLVQTGVSTYTPTCQGYTLWYSIAYAQYHGDRRRHEMVPAFVTKLS